MTPFSSLPARESVGFCTVSSLPLRGGGTRSVTERCCRQLRFPQASPQRTAATPLSQPAAASSPQGEPFWCTAVRRPPRKRNRWALHRLKPPLEGRWHGEAMTERCEELAEQTRLVHRAGAATPLSLASRASSPQGEPFWCTAVRRPPLKGSLFTARCFRCRWSRTCSPGRSRRPGWGAPRWPGCRPGRRAPRRPQWRSGDRPPGRSR